MKKKAIRLIIKGKVQGVGYRRFAQKRALECNVSGWTRNLTNGDVEVYAVGRAEDLQNYYFHLKNGPALGRVDEIVTKKVDNEKITGKPMDFSILPDGEPE